jgi:hypothetical protein
MSPDIHAHKHPSNPKEDMTPEGTKTREVLNDKYNSAYNNLEINSAEHLNANTKLEHR